MAIVNPLKPRMGKKATLCVAIVIWIIGAILSLPMLLFYTTYTQNFMNGEVRVVCYSDWPNTDDNGLSYDEYLYNVIFMILTYFLPIGSMTFTYARVGLELWGSQSIGEATARQLENIRSKRRVVKMMIVVVVIFAVCWLPFHMYFIVTSYLPEITNKPYIQEVFLGIYWLAMSNSMYNPIIYCWMNTRFRRGFAQFFFWCPWVRVMAEPSLSRSEAVTSRYSYTGSPDMHTRISRNGTCTLSEHTCTTGSTTPRSESVSHFEDTDPDQGDARTSSIDLCHMAPTSSPMSIAAMLSRPGIAPRTDHREIPSEAYILPPPSSPSTRVGESKISARDPSPVRDTR